MFQAYISIFLIGCIVRLLRSLILKERITVLSCGLWGYSGASSPDADKIRILALFNLSRGEQATGYYADKVLRKTLDNAGAFLGRYWKEMEALNNMKYPLVIGHDRRSSSGSHKDVELAHPHTIMEEGEIKFVLAHNGTLSNTYQMVQHYKVEHELQKNSDSQALMKCMYSQPEKEMLDPLKRYEGTATVVFHIAKYRNTVFIHRDPERELFYYQESEDKLYWSSIKVSLYAIGGTDETVKEFNPYELVKIQKGKITTAYSTKERIPFVKPQSTPYKGGKTVGFHGRAAGYKHNDIPPKTTLINAHIGTGLTFSNHRYLMNGERLQGELYVNRVKNEYSKTPIDGFEKLHFVQGYMAYSETAYKELLKLGNLAGSFDARHFENQAATLIAEYTTYPVQRSTTCVQGTVCWNGAYHKQHYRLNKSPNLQYTPLFHDKQYTLTPAGTLVGAEMVKNFTPVKEVREVTQINNGPKRGEYKDITEATLAILRENNVSDFSQLFDSVRYAVDQKATSDFFDKLVTAFIDICIEAQVVQAEYAPQLKGASFIDRESYEHLNIALRMYASNKPLEDYTMEDHIKDLQGDWSLSEAFKRDVIEANYPSLDDLLIAYCDTDDDATCRPVLNAVLYEMHKQNLITAEEIHEMQNSRISDYQRSLGRIYDIYVELTRDTEGVQEACEDSCSIETPTDVIARLWLQFADIRTMPIDKITETDKSQVETLRATIKGMLQDKKVKIDEYKLKNNYGLEIEAISASI